MPTHTYDIAIIGAGTAGLAALREVQRHTDDFVIVNDGVYGTTCARIGCMPSKALIESANAFHRREKFAGLGIKGTDSLVVDVADVLQRVRRLRDRFTADITAITQQLGDRSIAGRARFVESNALEVNDRRITAKRIIIATGSRPVCPPQWRAFGERVFTTDTLFERQSLPQSMAVIGMGSIGAELSQALARLGIRIAAFGSKPLVAGLSDPTVNDTLVALLRKEMDLHLGTPAALTQDRDGRLRASAGEQAALVDGVLVALGRRPNIDGLGWEHTGARLDRHGVPMFDRSTLQIGDLPIFLAGDVVNDLPVLHEAADDGYVAGTNTTTQAAICFQRRVRLGIVFCDPNVAVVGTPHAQLDAAAIVAGTVDFTNQGRATLAAENHGVVRVYAARGDGRLLGAELCAPRGEHFAHLLALAIERRLSVQDLLRMPFYHPVFEEGLRTALRELSKQLHWDRPSDLASCKAVGASALD